LGHFLFWF